MRGLLMALFAFDFAGHGPLVRGRAGASHTKTSAKTTTKSV